MDSAMTATVTRHITAQWLEGEVELIQFLHKKVPQVPGTRKEQEQRRFSTGIG